MMEKCEVLRKEHTYANFTLIYVSDMKAKEELFPGSFKHMQDGSFVSGMMIYHGINI